MNFVHIYFLKHQVYVKQYTNGIVHSRMSDTMHATFCVWHEHLVYTMLLDLVYGGFLGHIWYMVIQLTGMGPCL